MNEHTQTPRFSPILQAVAVAPAVLLAYSAFAVIITVIDFVILPLASESLRASIVPFTGWGLSGCYCFTIFFALTLIFQSQGRNKIRFTGIVTIMLIQIGYGIFMLSKLKEANYGNPYLTVSPWQPVWTILVPAIWIALLYTPSMNRFCNQASKPNVS
jgi:hypothetical protein